MHECERCGTAFKVHSNRPGKFCSRECYNEGRKEVTAVRTEKCCSRCRAIKPLADFPKGAGTDGLRANCRECESAAYRVWFMEKKYGISVAKYDEMFAAQGGGCAICRTAEPAKDGRRFAIDHDHSCCPGGTSCGKCVRGLLCGRCNSAIGLFAEDADRMHRAIEYVLTR